MTELAGPRLGPGLPIDTDISDQSWVCRCPLSITRVTPLLCREILPQISRTQGAGRRERGSDLMSAVVFVSAQLPTAPSSTLSLWLTTQNPTFLFVSRGLLLLISTPPPPQLTARQQLRSSNKISDAGYKLYLHLVLLGGGEVTPLLTTPSCTRVSISGYLRCTSLISSCARVPRLCQLQILSEPQKLNSSSTRFPLSCVLQKC